MAKTAGGEEEGSKDGPKKVPPKDVLPWGFSND